MILAYKSKPNNDGKTEYVEYVAIIKNWKEKMFFEATCKITEYNPFFITINKKEYKKIKKENGWMKLYSNKIKEIFNDIKNDGVGLLYSLCNRLFLIKMSIRACEYCCAEFVCP